MMHVMLERERPFFLDKNELLYIRGYWIDFDAVYLGDGIIQKQGWWKRKAKLKRYKKYPVRRMNGKGFRHINFK